MAFYLYSNGKFSNFQRLFFYSPFKYFVLITNAFISVKFTDGLGEAEFEFI
jgi:hypothetical protein